VWVKTGNDPDIVAYVKAAQYDETKRCWIYTVQEKDKDEWVGIERSRRETALERA
jgi:hypothetical protein